MGEMMTETRRAFEETCGSHVTFVRDEVTDTSVAIEFETTYKEICCRYRLESSLVADDAPAAARKMGLSAACRAAADDGTLNAMVVSAHQKLLDWKAKHGRG